ncbi:MAG: glycosyltransferase family 4 protein [Methanomassiliicoccales archaeon]|nr:glycosyltransferase family 4 protein [Methanomassiliicoccales archaeon]
MPKRILMLLSNEYRPDPRVEKEARALISEGYSVEVVAWDRLRRRPKRSSDNGLQINRIRTGLVEGPRSLLVNFPIFLTLSVVHSLRASCDAVHAHDLDTLVQGFIVSRIKRIPLVYDAHEHFSKMVESDVSSFLARLLDSIEKRLVPRASLVIAANDMIGEYLSRYSRSEVVVVMNCIDVENVHRAPPTRRDGEIVLFYGGSLEPLRYLDEMIIAVKSIKNCRLRIAGTGRLEELVKRESKIDRRIEFLGYVPHDDLLKEMASSDAVLCLLDPSNENNRIGTPNRLFESMAIGVPVMTTNGTFSGRITQETGCGIAIDWSERNFADAVERLREPSARMAMGRNGRVAAESTFNWAAMKRRLLDRYRSLLR